MADLLNKAIEQSYIRLNMGTWEAHGLYTSDHLANLLETDEDITYEIPDEEKYEKYKVPSFVSEIWISNSEDKSKVMFLCVGEKSNTPNQSPAQEVQEIDATQAAKSLAHTLSSLVSEWKHYVTFRDDLSPDEQSEEIENMAKIVAFVKAMHPEITEFYDLLERNAQ